MNLKASRLFHSKLKLFQKESRFRGFHGNKQYRIVNGGGKIDIINKEEDFIDLSIKPMKLNRKRR